jgi:hypothetical protein
MTAGQKAIPIWILIVSAIFALLEVMVSVALITSPESMADTVDLTAKGVTFLVNMWAIRQFALGFIFAFATWKMSRQMLTIAYIFFLVMMLGDLLIGISMQENSMILGAVVMISISSAMIFALHRRK